MKSKLILWALPFLIWFTKPDNLAMSGMDCVPAVAIQEQIKNRIAVKQLLTISQLNVMCGENITSDWKIESFQMVWVPKKQDPRMIVNRGGRFSAEVVATLTKANKGDKVYFENVVLINQASDTLLSNGIYLHIK